jgi:hypothetical protein
VKPGHAEPHLRSCCGSDRTVIWLVSGGKRTALAIALGVLVITLLGSGVVGALLGRKVATLPPPSPDVEDTGLHRQ